MMQCASAPSNKKSTTAANSFSARRRKQTTKYGLHLFVASSTPRTTPAVKCSGMAGNWHTCVGGDVSKK